MKTLEMTPELKKLNSLLEYMERRLETAIWGIEARFYQTHIRNIQCSIERLVEAQICPYPIIDIPGDFTGC